MLFHTTEATERAQAVRKVGTPVAKSKDQKRDEGGEPAAGVPAAAKARGLGSARPSRRSGRAEAEARVPADAHRTVMTVAAAAAQVGGVIGEEGQEEDFERDAEQDAERDAEQDAEVVALAGRRAGRNASAVRAPGEAAPPTTAQFLGYVVLAVPLLERWASRLTSNRADALDLVQATCQRALERRHLFVRGSFHNVSRWLMTIMRNIHRDAIRRWQHEQLTPWLDDLPAQNAESLRPRWSAVADEQVAKAVSALRPHMREVYTLYAVERLSYAKIAERLNIPTSTVATRVFRARSRLRALLSSEGNMLERRG